MRKQLTPTVLVSSLEDQTPGQNNSEMRGSFWLMVPGQSLSLWGSTVIGAQESWSHCTKCTEQGVHAYWYSTHSPAQDPSQGLPTSTNVINISEDMPTGLTQSRQSLIKTLLPK